MLRQYKDIKKKHLDQISAKLEGLAFDCHNVDVNYDTGESIVLIRIDNKDHLAYFNIKEELTDLLPR